MAVPTHRTARRNGLRFGRFLGVSMLAGAVLAGMSLPAVGGLSVGVKSAVAAFDSLPTDLEASPLAQRTYIESADGKRIATLYTENRIVVPLEKISPVLQEAIIAVEDVRFREHSGVDLKSTARALAANSSAGGVQQGSSTITMQYVRNILIGNAKSPAEIEEARARSLARKLQEMRYAIALEKRMSKDDILAGYLNIAYFGAGAYGAEAAAHRYFGVSADKLSLPQAATLAGLVQQPVGYDPTRNPDLATVRRNVVLDKMVESGNITPAQAKTAKAIPMKKTLNPQPETNGCADSDYPFYCDFAVRQIESDPRYGATVEERQALLKRGGMVIHTGLNTDVQKYAAETVSAYIPKTDSSRKAVALAMVRPADGVVTTLAQNRDWGTKGIGSTTYNYAVDQAQGGTIGMQAGSTFKIFTLVAAMEAGEDPYEYISSPSPKTFEGGNWGCKGNNFKSYTVHNSTSSGTMNMFQGAAYSVNTYFVELERRVGLCKVVAVADRMGVKLATGKPLPQYPSFTLGTLEVSPLALASAYATVANHGVYCKPHAVTSITDLTGRKLFTDDGSCKQVISRGAADATTAILSNVIDGGISGRTGSNMSLGRDAAGKTGTTDDNAAVWFSGFTPDLATAVWVGDPRGGFKYPLQYLTINGRYYSNVHGSSLPGPIWRQVMSYALDSTGASSSFELKSRFDLLPARQGGATRRPYSYYNNYSYDFGNYGDYGFGNDNGDDDGGDSGRDRQRQPVPAATPAVP